MWREIFPRIYLIEVSSNREDIDIDIDLESNCVVFNCTSWDYDLEDTEEIKFEVVNFSGGVTSRAGHILRNVYLNTNVDLVIIQEESTKHAEDIINLAIGSSNDPSS